MILERMFHLEGNLKISEGVEISLVHADGSDQGILTVNGLEEFLLGFAFKLGFFSERMMDLPGRIVLDLASNKSLSCACSPNKMGMDVEYESAPDTGF